MHVYTYAYICVYIKKYINVCNYIKEKFYIVLYLLFLCVSYGLFHINAGKAISFFLMTAWNFIILLFIAFRPFPVFCNYKCCGICPCGHNICTFEYIWKINFYKWNFWIKFPFKILIDVS